MAGLVLGVLLVMAVLAMSIRTGDQISTFGSGSGTVEIELPQDRERAKPTTLTVAPGKTTVLDQPIQRQDNDPTPGPPPEQRRAGGLNWMALAQVLGPPIGAAVLAWRYGRQRVIGPLEEVNMGVYKGAMPLEMISAHYRDVVFTRDRAHRHLFGRTREHFVPTRPAVMARPQPAQAAARASARPTGVPAARTAARPAAKSATKQATKPGGTVRGATQVMPRRGAPAQPGPRAPPGATRDGSADRRAARGRFERLR